ncbi:MAG: M14 family metallopeptidase, partial [Myxococcota bacterium]
WAKRSHRTAKKRLSKRFAYKRARWYWCRRYGVSNRSCRRAWKRPRPKRNARIIHRLQRGWERRLARTSPRRIRWIQRRREKYFPVSRWYFERYKRDRIYRLVTLIDALFQPVLPRIPRKTYRSILRRASALLSSPALSMPRQTTLTSHLSRWLVRRPDRTVIHEIRRRMQRSMHKHRNCPWWYLVFMQTFTPKSLARFSKTLSPQWCSARKIRMYLKYHTPKQTHRVMARLARRYKRYAKRIRFGTSFERRPLYALRLQHPKSSPSQRRNPKHVLLVGGQHADEHMGTECLLDLAKFILRRPNMRNKLLKHQSIWLIPVLNPDGMAFDLAGGVVKYWRYNRSTQADGQIGVDLNRNYDDHWKPYKYRDRGRITLPGTHPFSEPETLALARLAKRLKNITAILDLHQYGRVLLLPRAHTKAPLPQPFEDLYYRIGQYLIEANRYRTFPAHRLYPHQGTLGDWGHFKHNALSLVLEIGSSLYLRPKKQRKVTLKNRKLLLRFLNISDQPFQKIKDIPLDPPNPILVKRSTYPKRETQ